MYSRIPNLVLGFHGCDRSIGLKILHSNGTLHSVKKMEKEKSFDSVRGVFVEGKELYPSAGFREKNHIQLCIRNPNCIKGYFHFQDFLPDYIMP